MPIFPNALGEAAREYFIPSREPGPNLSTDIKQLLYSSSVPSGILLTHGEQKIQEPATISVSNENNIDQVYELIKAGTAQNKSLYYGRDEVEYLLQEREQNIINRIDSLTTGEIIAMSFVFPIKYFPEASNRTKTHPLDYEFPPDLFSSNFQFNELRAIHPRYQKNGLGKLLRSKQVLDAAHLGIERIYLYSIPEQLKANKEYGLLDLGLLTLQQCDQNDNKVNFLFHFMQINITQEAIDRAETLLRKYLIIPNGSQNN